MIDEEEIQRVLAVLAALYMSAYAEAAYDVAWTYGLEGHLKTALDAAETKLKDRVKLVSKAIQNYAAKIDEKLAALRAEGTPEVLVRAEIHRYAVDLANDRGELISAIEFAKARLDGAGEIVDSSGAKFEWRFPHLADGGHGPIECPTCEAVRRNSPYTTEEAAEHGWPDILHPNCDHAWILVPVGEKAHEELR